MDHPELLKPFFSIITPAYNSGKTIARTVESLEKQSFSSWEHIIIDGDSKDNTLEIVKSFPDLRRTLISERDHGIYDAMNKGISIARGKYICFLNSDDEFASLDILLKVQLSCENCPEVVYGNAYIIDAGIPDVLQGKEVHKGDYYFDAPIVHQAMFFRNELFEKYGKFNLHIQGGAADWVWLARYFESNHGETVYIGTPFINFYRGGASNRFAWQNLLARIAHSRENFPFWVTWMYYTKIPVHYLKFRVLRLNQDTPFRRMIRRAKSKLNPFSAKAVRC